MNRVLQYTHKKIIQLSLVVGCVASMLSPYAATATALSGNDFQAGRIIDNAVFYNANAMSVGDIQNFLNTQVPNCDTNGTQTSEYGGGTRAQYGSANGHPAPFTCLKDYYQNPQTGADNYGSGSIPSGAISAAQIIYNAAQTSNINPQVLLVTLQKESAIVTDDWPWTSQYKTAMGYGCPDTAACDSQYFGFYNQVSHAAAAFHSYSVNPNYYNYVPGTNNSILWNPNTSCGRSSVYIQNQATASLYNYTPYQPNQAALNNLYGTGDSCSTYGNRNFWRMFNSWFGTTLSNQSAYEEGISQKRVQPLVFNNQIYIFYYDAFNRVLRMATQSLSNGQWQYTILDGSNSATSGKPLSIGGDVSATVYGNSIQLMYYDKTNGNLRHGWYNGSSWSFENLDGDAASIGRNSGDVGINPSLTAYSGSLQAFYYDKTGGRLRHAWADTKGWHFENLDGDVGSVGHVTGDIGAYSTVASYNNTLQVFYNNQSNKLLRHAWADTKGWHFENLDGDVGSMAHHIGDVGISPVASAYGDSLQVFYYDRGHKLLRHAWADTKGWHFENLDGDVAALGGVTANVGLGVNIATYGNSLQVLYYNQSSTVLRHAWADVNGWHFENLDGDVGSISKITGKSGINPGAVQYGSSLQTYYYDQTTGALRHAWADSGGWHFENIGPSVIY